MPQVLVTEQYLEDIADSIRAKNGSANTYTPAQMASAIDALNTSGGGGSTNILHGTADPTSQDGSNGSIYIKHSEIGTPINNLLADYQNIDLWAKDKAKFSVHIVQYADGVSRLTHQGGSGYERIFVPVDVESNTDYTFILQFYPEINVSAGYGSALAISVSQDDQADAGSSGTYNNLGKTNLSRTAANAFSTYYVNFNSGAYTRIYPIIDLNISDGELSILNFKNVFLVKGTYTFIPATGNIEKVMLRKNNVWNNIIGSSITDVNLG